VIWTPRQALRKKLQRDVTAAEKGLGHGAAGGNLRRCSTQAICGSTCAFCRQQARLARLQAEIGAADRSARTRQKRTSGIRKHRNRPLTGLTVQTARGPKLIGELERRLGFDGFAARSANPAFGPEQIGEVAGLHPCIWPPSRPCPAPATAGEVTADLARRMQALGLADARSRPLPLRLRMLARLRARCVRCGMWQCRPWPLRKDEADKAETRWPPRLGKVWAIRPRQRICKSLGHLCRPAAVRPDPEASRDTRLFFAAKGGFFFGAARDAELAKRLLAMATVRGTANDLSLVGRRPAPWQIAAWDAADPDHSRALREAARCAGNAPPRPILPRAARRCRPNRLAGRWDRGPHKGARPARGGLRPHTWPGLAPRHCHKP